MKTSNINVVLTMAGNYKRFKLFGARVPKYLLPVGIESILSLIIGQIIDSCKSGNIYLIANREDQIFYPVVKSIMRQYSISLNHCIYIDNSPSQLATALYCGELIEKYSMDTPIAFTNIDTVLINRNKFFLRLSQLTQTAGLIDTFPGDSLEYSYIRTEKTDTVAGIEDHHRLSKMACSGLYGFGSFNYMCKKATELLASRPDCNFTELYKNYLSQNLRIEYQHSPNKNETIVLGTPEEYVMNIHRFR
jgi:dTDP-glucose pyrophosphorylase